MALWPLAMVEWLAGRWEEASAHAGASPTSSLSRPSTRTPSTGSGGRKRSSRPISASSTRRARRRKRPSSTLASASELYTNVARGRARARRARCSETSRPPAAACASFPGRLVTGWDERPERFPSGRTCSKTLAGLGDVEPCPYAPRAVRTLPSTRLDSPLALEYLPTIPRTRSRQPEATSIRGSRRSSSCSRSSPIPPGRSNARGRVLSSAQPGGRRSRSALPARHIEAAIATFDQLGAVLWAEKANSELRRISGRRAPSGGSHGNRAPRCFACCRRTDEQGDRSRALHGREHRRGAPLARVSQARDPLSGSV